MGLRDFFRARENSPEEEFAAPEPEEPAQVEPVKDIEKKDILDSGFKIGEMVLLRSVENPDDVFRTLKAEVSGPGDKPEKIKIKYTQPGARSSIIVSVYSNDLLKLGEDEQRLLEDAGLKEFQLFKRYLSELYNLEERKKDLESRKILERPFEEKWYQAQVLKKELLEFIQQEAPDIKDLKKLEDRLHYLIGEVNTMLDNLEENYPSDDKVRIRERSRKRYYKNR